MSVCCGSKWAATQFACYLVCMFLAQRVAVGVALSLSLVACSAADSVVRVRDGGVPDTGNVDQGQLPVDAAADAAVVVDMGTVLTPADMSMDAPATADDSGVVVLDAGEDAPVDSGEVAIDSGVSPCTTNAECADTAACTFDTCISGTCMHAAMNTLCDDGEPCTRDTCSSRGCSHASLLATSCDDGNPCTTSDRCARGHCIGTLVDAVCDDGSPCTTGDSCMSVSGVATCVGTATCPDCVCDEATGACGACF